MKRNRHQRKPKFIESSKLDSLAAELPDLMCDLPEHHRRPDYTTWLTMRGNVFASITAAAELLTAQGKTPTTETITGLLGTCYSRETIEIACEELKRTGRLLC